MGRLDEQPWDMWSRVISSQAWASRSLASSAGSSGGAAARCWSDMVRGGVSTVRGGFSTVRGGVSTGSDGSRMVTARKIGRVRKTSARTFALRQTSAPSRALQSFVCPIRQLRLHFREIALSVRFLVSLCLPLSVFASVFASLRLPLTVLSLSISI